MSLSPATPLPKPGHRFVLPALHGAAEAYVLAQAACALKANGQMLAIVVADAPSAQRLLDRKSTRLNSSHVSESRMPSSA